MRTSIKLLMLAFVILVGGFVFYIRLGIAIEAKSLKIQELYGVNVHYNYTHQSFFARYPEARASQAWRVNITSTLPLIEEFLSKYPRRVVNENLTDIFILGTIDFFGKKYGGTYIDSSIYISTGGFLKPDDSSLLGIMHAEFSSILLKHYGFPTAEWQPINKPSWRYLGSGSEMLEEKGLYSQTEGLLADGFLNRYSQASLEEDFNIFVEWMFTKPDRLRELASMYERIRKKRELVMKFYQSIDPAIDIPILEREQ